MSTPLICGLAAVSLAAVSPPPNPPVLTGNAPSAMAETLFLIPESDGAAPGRDLELRLERGGVGPAEPRQPVTWASVPATWFFIRTAGTQENRDTPAADPAALDAVVSVPVTRDGVIVVGMEAQPRVETVAAETWAKFAERALDPTAAGAIAATLPAGAPVRIRRVESAKAIIRVGTGSEIIDAQTATSRSGQAAEIRLLQDATGIVPKSDLQVRSYTDYAARGGVHVLAACDACPDSQTISVDRYGIGLLHLSDPGRWRVVTNYALRLPAGEDADVVLFTGSLVFETAQLAEEER